MSRTLLLRIAALLAATAAGFFAFRALAENWGEASDALVDANPMLLVTAIALGAVGTVIIALAWGQILSYLAPPDEQRPAVAWYFMGELAKYLPGSAWSVIGRSELAQRSGVQRATAYLSVLASLLGLYGTALVMTTTMVLIPGTTNGPVTFALAAAVVAIVIAAAHPAAGGRLIPRLSRLARAPAQITAPRHEVALAVIGIYAIAWVLIGLATAVVAWSLGVDSSVSTLVLAAITSWLAGFVVVFAPGGIGIREAAFIAVSGLDTGDAALVAVASRLLFVFIDVGGAVLAALWTRELRRRGERSRAKLDCAG